MAKKKQQKQSLVRLAAAYGIQSSYTDIWGTVQEIPEQTLKQMLTAMGVDVSHPEETLTDLEKQSWSQLATPVLVASTERMPTELHFQIPVADLPAKEHDRMLHVVLEICSENLTPIKKSYQPEQLAFKQAVNLNGRKYERWGLPFPNGLTTGYYQFDLTVETKTEKHQQSVFVLLCPEKAYLPPALQGTRRAGIAVSLYGLRSSRNWGVGDFHDLKEFIRWAVDSLHADVIGLNPLHAITNAQPHGISPYYPSSKFYRNFIYLDVENIKDYHSCPEAFELVEADTTQELLSELRASELVQYERVAEIKLNVLGKVFQSFLHNHWSDTGSLTQRGKQFEQYIEKEGDLLDNFATFCALDASFKQNNSDIQVWWQWPEPFQDPFSEEVDSFRQNQWQSVLFYKYLQWQLEVQLEEAQQLATSLGGCVGLYHDLALGSDPGGADFWAHRNLYVNGVSVGAPPDDFSPEGQDWGFHPPSRERFRSDGYRLFIEELRKNCQAGGALRIDHLMRFFRLFWIIADRPPKEGTYVQYYHEELLKILSLVSQRSSTLIIGEDLGTVPPYVRETSADYCIFSYRVFYFERDEQGNFKEPASYPPHGLATVSTHDLPTLAGFWTAEDISLRSRLGLFADEAQLRAALTKRREEKQDIIQRLVSSDFLTKDLLDDPDTYTALTTDVHSAVIGFLLSTPAKLAILSQEDLFKDTRQQNLPGTVSEHPNWSTKMKYTLEELWHDTHASECTLLFRTWIERTGRCGRSSG